MKQVLFILAFIALIAVVFSNKVKHAAYPDSPPAPTYEQDSYEAWSDCQERIRALEKEIEELRWQRQGDTLIYHDTGMQIVYPNHGHPIQNTGSEYPYQ